MDSKKCIVFDCENRTGQGNFVGDLCAPCHALITTGKLNNGKTFLHRAVETFDLFSKIMRGRNIMGVGLMKLKGMKKHMVWKSQASRPVSTSFPSVTTGYGSTPHEAMINLLKRIKGI